jgi:hypothetical protein
MNYHYIFQARHHWMNSVHIYHITYSYSFFFNKYPCLVICLCRVYIHRMNDSLNSPQFFLSTLNKNIKILIFGHFFEKFEYLTDMILADNIIRIDK